MDTLRGPFDEHPEDDDESAFEQEFPRLDAGLIAGRYPGSQQNAVSQENDDTERTGGATDAIGTDESDRAQNDRRDTAVTDPDDGLLSLSSTNTIGVDERRMQVRAYNHWASLLDDRKFPSIDDLEPTALPDFSSHSVLLDFSAGVDDPLVQHLGDAVFGECVGNEWSEGEAQAKTITRLSDVPTRSLLSRITDHYMQIIANQAPIGFEAEFVNLRGVEILYRGILLPFSSDGNSIDFVFGVINWKQMADAATADELLLEIDQALASDMSDAAPTPRSADPLTEWADSPVHETDDSYTVAQGSGSDGHAQGAGHITSAQEAREEQPDGGTPSSNLPDFNQYGLDGFDDEEDYDEEGNEAEGGGGAEDAAYSFASLADYIEAPVKKAIDLDAAEYDADGHQHDGEPGLEESSGSREEPQPLSPALGSSAANENVRDAEPSLTGASDPLDEMPPPQGTDLSDWLDSARELARSAHRSEDRSRTALYAAVGRAYDFSLVAQNSRDEYEALIESSGLRVQDRAPMTPIVKLVFGADYDKTRLTEYAAVLSHAHRTGIERGTLAAYLGEAEGGLKGVVQAERRQRRKEAGDEAASEGELRTVLAEKLRELDALMLSALPSDGPEFSLAVLRRNSAGGVEIVGEVADDSKLVERAAKRLLG